MRKLLLLSGILAFWGTQFANADTVEVRIINVVGSAAVGDTGWLQCAPASCNFTGSVGNWDIASDLTVQHTASNPLLDLAYSASAPYPMPGSPAGDTIIIEGMANGYAVNTPSFELIDSGHSTFDISTFTDDAYGGNNNNICGASSCWNGTSNPAPNGTSSATIANGGLWNRGTWGVDQLGPGNSVDPYSLGLIVSLDNVGCGIPIQFCVTGTFSGDAKLDAVVPEPASVMLLGGVLLFAAAGLRRRTRKA